MSVDAPERHLRLLTETIAAVNSTLDLEEVLSLVASKVAEALAADACFVYLYDERADELVLRAALFSPDGAERVEATLRFATSDLAGPARLAAELLDRAAPAIAVHFSGPA